jgi:alkylhydroperoxidase/carboxymuconolactone decarboxylase family protein YurZ
MAQIAEWLNEAHQNKMADLVIEDTLDDLKRRDASVLDPYVPFKTYSSRQFLAYVMEQINVIASVTAYGQEPPITNQGTFRRINAELMKSTLGYVWDEEYQWHMKEAMAEAAAKNIMVQKSRDGQGNTVNGSNMDLAGFIFGTVEKLARSQVELLNHLAWQGLQFGSIDRVDPRTGLKTKLDYRNPNDISYNHFPAALAGTDRWDQYATANGIQNLYDAVDTYVDTNGFAPDCIYMSRKLLNDLMQQAATKNSASSLTVTQVGTVSPNMLGALLEARGIPAIKTYDEKYRNEFADQTIANTRFLNDNRFVFVKEDMGERAMGPTLENDGKEGVYVTTYEKQKVPPVDVSQCVATILPVFADPKLLYSIQCR